ncbi:GHKL domain-containing protein [Mariniphaga sediminis]|jgi:signal transduction histidine kinase|uniref:histidine kinase n=1 Tax=Mariniphaga sediminis TaxID=1628158 RepID=A0A399CSL8_9BACT|nr:ATP-binding protein [Mariniphaga sediminis]RIH62879.1 GHKL domain-containing protein [Mariniphaga sediminis]
MVKFFSFITRKEPAHTLQLINEEILKQNVERLIYLAGVGIPAAIIHIVFFSINLSETSSNDYTWRLGIIFSRSIIVLILLVIGFIGINHKRKSIPNKKTMQWLFHFFYSLGILIAVWITIIDQLVTTSINPFLIICIVLSVFFLVRPVWALLNFSAGFLLLSLFLPKVQADQSVLLSNISYNLTTLIVVGILSIVMWNLFRSKMKQSITIAEQTKQLEIKNRELKEQSAKQQMLIKMRDKFFSVIAHDLRSPLNGVLGLSEIMYRETDQMSQAEIKNCSGSIWSSTKQTYLLLENLLEWAQMQQGQIKFSPAGLNLQSLVHENFDLLAENAFQKNIQLEQNIPSGLTVWADKSTLNSILRNLISNAIKFTEEGGDVSVSAKKEKNQVKIAVTDSGVGMEPSIIKNLFKEEEKTSTYGTKKEKGNGLGLILCKDFTERNGGTIHVESEPGKGSTFYVILPVSANAQQ